MRHRDARNRQSHPPPALVCHRENLPAPSKLRIPPLAVSRFQNHPAPDRERRELRAPVPRTILPPKNWSALQSPDVAAPINSLNPATISATGSPDILHAKFQQLFRLIL